MIYGQGRRYLYIGDPVQLTASQQAVDKVYAGFSDGVTVTAPIAKGQRMVVAFSLYNNAYTGPQTGPQLWANLRKHRALYSGADQALYMYQGGTNIYLSDDQLSWLSRG